MVVKVVNSTNDHHIVHANKPSSKKAMRANSRHDEFKVRHDKSLGGEFRWPPIQISRKCVCRHEDLSFFCMSYER